MGGERFLLKLLLYNVAKAVLIDTLHDSAFVFTQWGSPQLRWSFPIFSQLNCLSVKIQIMAT